MPDHMPKPVSLRRPRGRRLFEPAKPMLKDFVRKVAFLPVFLSGLYSAFMAQATALNYQWLFRFALVLTLIHIVLAGLYFRFVPGRLRWLGLPVSLLSLLSLTELGLRAFFG